MHLRTSKLTTLVLNDHQPSVAPGSPDAILRVHNDRGRHIFIYTYAVPSENCQLLTRILLRYSAFIEVVIINLLQC